MNQTFVENEKNINKTKLHIRKFIEFYLLKRKNQLQQNYYVQNNYLIIVTGSAKGRGAQI
jgi:hypothetical protein